MSEYEFNSITIEARPHDYYVNANQLCKAIGIEYDKWYSMEVTRGYLWSVQSTYKPRTDKLDVKSCLSGGEFGNSLSHLPTLIEIRDGTTEDIAWVHPSVAIHIAQWGIPQYVFNISTWVEDDLLPHVPLMSKPCVDPPESGYYFNMLVHQPNKASIKYRMALDATTATEAIKEFNAMCFFMAMTQGGEWEE